MGKWFLMGLMAVGVAAGGCDMPPDYAGSPEMPQPEARCVPGDPPPDPGAAVSGGTPDPYADPPAAAGAPNAPVNDLCAAPETAAAPDPEDDPRTDNDPYSGES